jgi:hypothetical protein
VLRKGVHVLGPEARRAFAALIAAQAAHSCEEYVWRLYESFPPARFVSSLVSSDLQRGFLIANLVVVGSGVWCLFGPVRHNWPSARPLAWLWVVIEFCNGIGHVLWSIMQGGYTPGVVTAPILFVLAVIVARRLRIN